MTYKLKNILPDLPRSSSNASVQLSSVLKTPPQPTTTLSGTEPGRALFDTPSPGAEDVNEVSSSHRSASPLSSLFSRTSSLFSRRSSGKRKITLTERGAGVVELLNATKKRSKKIFQGKARKLKGLFNYSGSNFASGEGTDGARSTEIVDSWPSGVPELSGSSPAAWDSGHRDGAATASTSSRAAGAGGGPRAGPRAAHRTQGAGGGEGSGRGAIRTDPSNAFPASRNSATTGTCTPATESQYRNLVEGELSQSQHPDFIDSLDPTTLAAHLAKYVEYDCSQISTQDLKALLQAYVEDNSPAVASPTQQTQRPVSPQANQPIKRAKVTIEEIENVFHTSDTESSSSGPTIPDTNTDTESEPDFPAPQPSHNRAPINPNVGPALNPPFGRPDPPTTRTLTQSRHKQSRAQPSTVANSTLPGQPSRTLDQSSSRIPPQQSTNPWAFQRLPVRPSASASSSAPPAGRRNFRATSPFGLATSHLGLPPTRTNLDRPTERERELSARVKAADRLLKVTAEPKHARRGLRIPNRLSEKTAKVAATVREAYRKLATAASGGRPMEPDSSTSRGNLDDDLVDDNEEELVAQAAAAAGKEPQRRKRKPSSHDVHGYERQILTTAKMHLFAMTLLEGAYQTRAWLMKMAKIVFIETWRQELPEVPIELPTQEVLQVMVNSLATSRGQVKLAIRPIVEYGFDLLKWDTSPEAVNHNLQIFSNVHPNVFHCLEFNPVYGHYESDLLTKAIAATLFNGPYSVGATFHDYFEPMPLTTVAFILANMQFCLEEWETGQYQPHDLKTSGMLNKYIAHLRGLKEARRAAKGRMARLQDHWFEFGFEFSGATPTDPPIYQPITLRGEVRPDTPVSDNDQIMTEQPPESDDASSDPDEPETYPDGRYTAKTKGKSRA
ncbi:hypothetical protein FRC06_011745 [Ceratobasidium sp. 370]|nr:hypothetical protein FRC06_011745 [Ceratobasidium sp. 370]